MMESPGTVTSPLLKCLMGSKVASGSNVRNTKKAEETKNKSHFVENMQRQLRSRND
jgi:hypothetical protein